MMIVSMPWVKKLCQPSFFSQALRGLTANDQQVITLCVLTDYELDGSVAISGPIKWTEPFSLLGIVMSRMGKTGIPFPGIISTCLIQCI